MTIKQFIAKLTSMSPRVAGLRAEAIMVTNRRPGMHQVFEDQDTSCLTEADRELLRQMKISVG